MKERFKATEWEQLRLLPFHLFHAIALADGEVQKEELQEFVQRVTRGALGYKDPLHRELARSIIEDHANFTNHLVGRGDTDFDMKVVKQFLKEKLTGDEYQTFLGSLFIDSVAIAAASKTGGLLRKKAICKEEQERLTAIALFWEVDPERVVGLMGASK